MRSEPALSPCSSAAVCLVDAPPPAHRSPASELFHINLIARLLAPVVSCICSSSCCPTCLTPSVTLTRRGYTESTGLLHIRCCSCLNSRPSTTLPLRGNHLLPSSCCCSLRCCQETLPPSRTFGLDPVEQDDHSQPRADFGLQVLTFCSCFLVFMRWSSGCFLAFLSFLHSAFITLLPSRTGSFSYCWTCWTPFPGMPGFLVVR